jgi:hypothetical protein
MTTVRDGLLPARSNEIYEGSAKSARAWLGSRFTNPILQECDNAEAAVFHHLTTLKHMKTRYLKKDWLILLLGLALVAGGFAATTTYLGLERKVSSGEAFSATLDRLYQSQKLSAALKTLHDGDMATAVQRLDLLLCDNILMINSDLALADDLKRAHVKDVFRKIALLRPQNPSTIAGATLEISNDQIEAEKILAQACVEITRAN